jgi:hypothetical protein
MSKLKLFHTFYPENDEITRVFVTSFDDEAIDGLERRVRCFLNINNRLPKKNSINRVAYFVQDFLELRPGDDITQSEAAFHNNMLALVNCEHVATRIIDVIGLGGDSEKNVTLKLSKPL